MRSEIVSSDAELLILVDQNDTETGTLDKRRAHDGKGILHRAFSLFIFNDDGDLLLQQRAADKRLWPRYWSNSCCSHPRSGEDMQQAVKRRCEQELGFSTDTDFLYKFQYQAQYSELGSEHELCSVYAGHYAGNLAINTAEIMAWNWCSQSDIEHRLAEDPDQFTPWFKLEWQQIRGKFADTVSRIVAERSGS